MCQIGNSAQYGKAAIDGGCCQPGFVAGGLDRFGCVDNLLKPAAGAMFADRARLAGMAGDIAQRARLAIQPAQQGIV